MIACEMRNNDLIHTLVSLGADLNKQNTAGNTPLHLLSEKGDYQSIDFLLSTGQIKEIPNKFGNTPLHVAARQGHFQVAQLLLASGFDKDQHAIFGRTLLYLAALNGHLQVVQSLLHAGADQSLCSAILFSPKSFAPPKVIQLLVSTLSISVGKRNKPSFHFVTINYQHFSSSTELQELFSLYLHFNPTILNCSNSIQSLFQSFHHQDCSFYPIIFFNSDPNSTVLQNRQWISSCGPISPSDLLSPSFWSKKPHFVFQFNSAESLASLASFSSDVTCVLFMFHTGNAVSLNSALIQAQSHKSQHPGSFTVLIGIYPPQSNDFPVLRIHPKYSLSDLQIRRLAHQFRLHAYFDINYSSLFPKLTDELFNIINHNSSQCQSLLPPLPLAQVELGRARILFLGDSESGKTTLINQIVSQNGRKWTTSLFKVQE